MKGKITTTVLALLCFSAVSNADILVYEGFSGYYDKGSDRGWSRHNGKPIRWVDANGGKNVNGGIGWKGAWYENRDNEKSYAGMPVHKESFVKAGVRTTGGHFRGGDERYRTFDTSSTSRLAKAGLLTSDNKIGKVGTSIYMSAYIGFTNANSWRGISLFDGSNEKMYIGKAGGQWKLDFSGQGRSIQKSGVNVSTDPAKPQFIVMKFTFEAGQTKIQFWINPNSENSKLVATATLEGSSAQAIKFNKIRLMGDRNSGDTILDEFRLATSFKDAVSGVPEPATMLLLAGGGLGVLLRRKRNKA